MSLRLPTKLSYISRSFNRNFQTLSYSLQKIALPPLFLPTFQSYKNYDIVPYGLLTQDLKSFNYQQYQFTSFTDLQLHLNRCSNEELGKIFHILITKFESTNSQSEFIRLIQLYLNRNYPILPLSFLPTLNSLKNYEQYDLWLLLFQRMKSTPFNLYREEILEELLVYLLPKLILHNEPNYFQLNFHKNLTFNTLTNLITEYSNINRKPNVQLSKTIYKISKRLNIGGYNSQQRKLLKDEWILASLKICLKLNQLNLGYKIYNEQLIKSLPIFNAFLDYFKSIYDREQLEKFWDYLLASPFKPNSDSFKIMLGAYFQMRDLRGVQLILKHLKSSHIPLDKEFILLVINGFIQVEPSIEPLLSILQSSLFDTIDLPRYELYLISLEQLNCLNQLDCFNSIYEPFLTELTQDGIILDQGILTSYFIKVIQYNQDPLDPHHDRFKALFDTIILANYPSKELKETILNLWVLSLIRGLEDIKDKQLLIHCIQSIQLNNEAFQFNSNVIHELNELNK